MKVAIALILVKVAMIVAGLFSGGSTLAKRRISSTQDLQTLEIDPEDPDPVPKLNFTSKLRK
ncbi:hypothetical protein JYU34_020072 [Plutella xylostella]|uniref:Uncharacterized protein n=1 Tax=Plutella xylostella TaxID=51655 RepID=A0ABQ7PXD6_PLUXY|nr:hypothetical protein JYU34_020072 [Plutella xylostella]